jgi:hypothetical protein
MSEVGDRFLARRDGKPLRHRAVPEAGKLRKDEPHPVALLLTAAQFFHDTRIDRRLRVDEALEIKGISHGVSLSLGEIIFRTRPAQSSSIIWGASNAASVCSAEIDTPSKRTAFGVGISLSSSPVATRSSS